MRRQRRRRKQLQWFLVQSWLNTMHYHDVTYLCSASDSPPPSRTRNASSSSFHRVSAGLAVQVALSTTGIDMVAVSISPHYLPMCQLFEPLFLLKHPCCDDESRFFDLVSTKKSSRCRSSFGRPHSPPQPSSTNQFHNDTT